MICCEEKRNARHLFMAITCDEVITKSFHNQGFFFDRQHCLYIVTKKLKHYNVTLISHVGTLFIRKIY